MSAAQQDNEVTALLMLSFANINNECVEWLNLSVTAGVKRRF